MKRKSRTTETKLVFEELEPRVLLSADPLALVSDSGVDAVHEQVIDSNEFNQLSQQSSTEHNQQQLEKNRTELVIIDSRAPNYQQLHNDLIKAQQQGRNIHVVVLDAHRDGIEQINEALQSYHKLDAVHIVSHGDDGQLQLGATQLNKTTLRDRTADISSWKESFTDGGDLLIYGCNLAETADGKSLVDSLSQLTATDVAASDDLTGNKILGGDWELEYEAGDIETTVAFSDDVQQNWQGTLEGAAPAAAEQQQAAEEQQQQQQLEQQGQAELEAQQAAINEEEQAAAKQDDGEQQAAITQEQRQEIVIIDESVTDFQSFIDDLQANSDGSTSFEIVLLDGDSDGIEQINEALSDYNDVDALHILSHGDDGALKLGNTWLNADNIDVYSDSLNAWSGSLDQNADILIYGCNLAETETGENFVNQLAVLTGADVAASDDNTGHASLSGDWDLEYHHGEIESSIAISSETQNSWSNVLVNFSVNTTVDTADANPGDGLAQDASGNTSLRAAIEEANALTGADTITIGAGTYTLSLGEITISSDITITGAGVDQTFIDGATLDRIFNITSGTVTINDLTIQNSDIAGSGGGLNVGSGAVASLNNVKLTGNTANAGGAINNDGTLNLVDVTIDNNTVSANGGGLFNTGIATLTNVTISNNAAGAFQSGGGIYTDTAGSNLIATNVTISGNYGGNAGGGLYVSGSATLQNVTITNNTSENGAGAYETKNTTVNIRNSIVAGNTSNNTPGDVYGDFTSLGYNLVGDSGAVTDFTDGVNGDQVGTTASPIDPLLGALADNGGSTLSHALLTGSTAIDAGTSTGAPATDQRGIARDSLTDIGAYEIETNNGSAIWGESGTSAPEISGWDGAAFGAEGTAANVGSWRTMQGAESPTRDEKIVVGVDSSGVITGMIWDGTSWSALPINPLATVSQSYWWGFDIQYEATSGDAVLVWANGNTGTDGISYAKWDGTSWSAAQTITTPLSGAVRQIQLAADPNSNDMIMVASNATSQDYALVWDGSAWGTSLTLDSGGGDDRTDINVAYESLSGQAIVTFGQNNTSLKTAIWNGSAWAAVGTYPQPAGVTGNVRWTTLASDPNSDRIAVGVTTFSNETWVSVWDGATWTDKQLATSSNTGTTELAVAVAFESSSGDLIATYGTSASNTVKYMTWSSGGGWSAEQIGPDIGAVPNSMTLSSDPTSNRIMLAANDDASDVNYVLWDGSAWATPTEHEIDSGETKNQPFLFLWDQQAINTAPTFIDGAVGNWSFDEGSGDSVAESAIGISGGTLGSTAGADANDPTWTSGIFGQALHFDGVDDYVEIADAPGIDISGPQFSASLWMNPDSGPNKEDMLFMKGDRQGNVNYYLSWKDSGVMTWAFKEGANWHYQDMPVTLPTTGQWNHVAITFDRPTVSLYVNGTKYVFDNVATGGSMDNDLTANDEVLWIGAGRDGGALVGVNQFSGPFSGSIDELALFDRALTDAEIEAIRTSTPPVVTASVFSIDENSATNTLVGTVVANDQDIGDTLSYAITAGNTGGAFSIDANGQIKVANSAALDFETNPVFNLTIEATDDGTPAKSDTTSVSISLNDANDIPTITSNGGGGTAGINVAENTTAVTTVTANDADLDTLTYSISGGTDAALFSIDSGSGALTFISAPNFEAPTDADTDNVYEVTVQASDGTASDTQAISVTVTEVLELAVTNTNATGTGSLHEAILNANTNTGVTDTITFNIPGAGPHVINLSGALPAITDSVIIDGTTDPDFAGDPIIRIDGSAAGAGVNGLTFTSTSDGSEVRGLMITGFTQHGIQVNSGADGITITNNWIGTTGTGSVGDGNGDTGIYIQGANTIVGGTGANDGNVITNNGNEGINVTGTGATGTVIQGNIIGLDPDGATGSGNIDVGIALLSGAHNTIIGGTTVAERNIISNNVEGIEINSNNNVVQGNYIGTDISGTLASGNRSDDGVEIKNGATGNLIGGTAAGAGNLIAFNALDGVNLVNGTDNTVLGNLIHSNSGLGIDLGTSGVTANDADDADGGANNLQNYPVITQADISGTNLTLSGTLDTDGLSTQYRIEFYGGAAGTTDATNGEGRVFLASTTVTTDGSGDASFSNVVLNGVTLVAGDYVTATVTRITDPGQVGVDDQLAYGATSEFAVNVAITPGNNAPVAVADNYTAVEGIPYTASVGLDDLLLNDSDLDGDTLTINTTPVSGPSNGELTDAIHLFDAATGLRVDARRTRTDRDE